MSVKTRIILITLVVALTGVSQLLLAASAKELSSECTASLNTLYSGSPELKKLGAKSVGILIFPKIKKAGFIVGGSGGEGCLRQAGKTTGYYQSAEGSVGLQAGVQWFGYALFFLDKASMDALLTSDKGWEVGTGPSLVVLDEGFGKSVTTATLKEGVAAYIFGQKGLMAGIGIKGSKITKIEPK